MTFSGEEKKTTPYMMIRGSSEEFKRLQRAWTQSGEYANRSQFIKAAVNSFAQKEIFE